MKVSIVIPVFNCSSYLSECLESIRNQSYIEFEVILIDDGSTDYSGDICKKFCKDDVRFRYFFQNNQGPSSARNYGLTKITGDFLTFVDADDLLKADAIYNMVNLATEWAADLVVCGIETFGIKKTEMIVPSYKELIVNKSNYISRIAADDTTYGGGFTFAKFWRTSAIKADEFVKFDNELKLYEDKLWVIENAKRVKKVLLVPVVVYKYRILADSLSHQNVSWRKEQILLASKKIMDACADCCNTLDYRNVKDMYAMQVMRSMKDNRNCMDSEHEKLVLNSIRSILTSQIINWRSKCKYIYACCCLKTRKWNKRNQIAIEEGEPKE